MKWIFSLRKDREMVHQKLLRFSTGYSFFEQQFFNYKALHDNQFLL